MKNFLVSMSLIVFVGGTATAQKPEEKGAHPPVTKEQRLKMATLHENMAACLKSDKSIHECHEQTQAECKQAMGDESCPMVHPMMRHKGKKMHGKMMHKNEGQAPTEK